MTENKCKLRCGDCKHLVLFAIHPDFGIIRLYEIQNEPVQKRIIGESQDVCLSCEMNCIKWERQTHNCAYFKEIDSE